MCPKCSQELEKLCTGSSPEDEARRRQAIGEAHSAAAVQAENEARPTGEDVHGKAPRMARHRLDPKSLIARGKHSLPLLGHATPVR
jgi:predicted  nucleic acid-binding Zn-ribbon protein